MNSALVLFAYFAMLLSPCFVAQWGDLLSSRWIGALLRRRRTHRAESFLVSLRHERYAMAVALEASFAASKYDYLTAPMPFVVPQTVKPVLTPSFLAARQRVAARVAQLAVAQKLRNAAEAPSKVVAIPADVAVPALDATHIRPRKQVPAVYQPARYEPAPRYTSAVGTAQAPPTSLVFAQHGTVSRPEFAETAAASPLPASLPYRGLEAVPSRKRKDESSGSLEVAA